jgi:hypothetical protein
MYTCTCLQSQLHLCDTAQVSVCPLAQVYTYLQTDSSASRFRDNCYQLFAILKVLAFLQMRSRAFTFEFKREKQEMKANEQIPICFETHNRSLCFRKWRPYMHMHAKPGKKQIREPSADIGLRVSALSLCFVRLVCRHIYIQAILTGKARKTLTWTFTLSVPPSFARASTSQRPSSLKIYVKWGVLEHTLMFIFIKWI